MTNVADPVGLGLIARLARPGGKRDRAVLQRWDGNSQQKFGTAQDDRPQRPPGRCSLEPGQFGSCACGQDSPGRGAIPLRPTISARAEGARLAVSEE